MISIPRKARPRRGPNRVALVELDGSPARPSAESWPSWTDNHYWEPTDRVVGTDSMGADVHASDCVPEPDETDAEWLARLEREEAEEKVRILADYEPTAEDMAAYAAWSQALDDGTLPPEASGRFSLESEPCFTRDEMDAIRRNQVSHDELCMLAAGMPI